MTLTEILLERAFEAVEHPAAAVAARRAQFDYLTCCEAARRQTELGPAVACALLDLDDVHWETGTHPGSMVWPSVSLRSDHVERAAIVGYEVMVRVARAFGPRHREHWHPTSTAGVLGAAAAGATSAGLAHDDVVAVVAHAASLSTGLAQGILEETDSVLVNRLHAQYTASMCVAARRLRPAAWVLEGERGSFAAFGGNGEPISAPLTRPAVADVSFRLHQGTGLIQDVVDVLLHLDAPLAPTPVHVVLPAELVPVVDRPAPTTAHDRWWSAQWVIAATLLGVDVHDAGHEQALAEAARLVTISAGDERVLVVEGRPSPVVRRDATNEDLLAKWRRLNPQRQPPLRLLA